MLTLKISLPVTGGVFFSHILTQMTITSVESKGIPSKIKASARPCTPIPMGLWRRFERLAVSTG
jgi:hypothetical protein